MTITTQTPARDETLSQKQLVGGEWVDAASGEWIEVENPARRTTIGWVPRSTEDDVNAAVAAAKGAFPAWRAMPARERGALLVKIGNRIDENKEELAKIIASETGNALRTQARGEAASAAELFRYYGSTSSEQKGETLPLGENLLSYTIREPLGVVGGIVPWNAPVQLATLKIAMALSTGNTIVLKAAELAPLGVLRLAEIASEFLPAGVLNVLTGTGHAVGAPLSKHPDVAKLTFTGSTGVGKSILAAAADRIVPVTLELGGKSPVIVFPDSDDDATVDGVIAGMRFTRQGQSCTAGSRLYLHRDIYDSFLQKLAAKLQQLVIGDPLDEATDMGAMVSQNQYDTVIRYIKSGQERGGEIIIGGVPEGNGSDGLYIEPTVISGVSEGWEVTREEIFGPVLVVLPWDDEEEVLRQANDSHYGLAGYVWCKDISTALHTAHRLESGWIQVNRGLGQLPGMAYGGIKQSGLGREHSMEGALDSFTVRKSITVAI